MSFLSAFVARQSLRPPVAQHAFAGYSGSVARARTFVRQNHSLLVSGRLNGTTPSKSLLPWLATGITVAGVGLGLSTLYRHPLLCDSPGGSPKLTPAAAPANPSTPTGDSLPPPPQSSVSLYELSFGTVAGVCAGVFVKKGAKMAAWFLGGIFVLLQYLNSASVVRVDWSRIAHKFENLFYTREAPGAKKPPQSYRCGIARQLFNCDFQPRASFLAGFALGLRVG